MTGREFRAIRLRLDLSQEALGKRMGVTRNTVNRWERGHLKVTKMAELSITCLLLQKLGRGLRESDE